MTVAQQTKWRHQPLRQILLAWGGLVWAGPVVAIVAIIVATATHTWETNYVVGRFLASAIYTTFFCAGLFSWNVVPLTFAIVSLARYLNGALGMVFWCAFILIHLVRFFASDATAHIYFSGLTGPGVGPGLDVLCPADVNAVDVNGVELAPQCAELAKIGQSIFAVTACLSLVLFALDVGRCRRKALDQLET